MIEGTKSVTTEANVPCRQTGVSEVIRDLQCEQWMKDIIESALKEQSYMIGELRHECHIKGLKIEAYREVITDLIGTYDKGLLYPPDKF